MLRRCNTLATQNIDGYSTPEGYPCRRAPKSLLPLPLLQPQSPNYQDVQASAYRTSQCGYARHARPPSADQIPSCLSSR